MPNESANGKDIANSFDPRQPVGKFMDVTLAPLWSVNEGAGIAPLAHFADGSVAAAVKGSGAGKSIYIGSAGCPAQLLRNILKDSGVNLYLDSDDPLITDGRFLSLTASSAGEKRIFLPGGIRTENMEFGETFRMRMDKGK